MRTKTTITNHYRIGWTGCWLARRGRSRRRLLNIGKLSKEGRKSESDRSYKIKTTIQKSTHRCRIDWTGSWLARRGRSRRRLLNIGKLSKEGRKSESDRSYKIKTTIQKSTYRCNRTGSWLARRGRRSRCLLKHCRIRIREWQKQQD
jgi:hypothetical protein